MTKLNSLDEARGYVGHFVGRDRAAKMSVAELSNVARQHGAELATIASLPTPVGTTTKIDDSATRPVVYREDRQNDVWNAARGIGSPSAPRFRDKRRDAFNAAHGILAPDAPDKRRE